jgi:hypothetical protein
MKQKARDMMVHLVEEIAETGGFKAMDKEGMERSMEELVEDNPFIQFTYVVNTKGTKVTKNITTVEYRAKFSNYGMNEDFSDRSWFINPMTDGKTYVTNFYTSKVTGELAITVATPIRDKDEEIVGVLGVDIKFEDLVKAE